MKRNNALLPSYSKDNKFIMISRYVLITVKGEYYTQPYSSGYSSAINKAGTTSNLNDAYLFNQQEIYKYRNFLEHVVEVEAIEHRTVELVKGKHKNNVDNV